MIRNWCLRQVLRKVLTPLVYCLLYRTQCSLDKNIMWLSNDYYAPILLWCHFAFWDAEPCTTSITFSTEKTGRRNRERNWNVSRICQWAAALPLALWAEDHMTSYQNKSYRLFSCEHILKTQSGRSSNCLIIETCMKGYKMLPKIVFWLIKSSSRRMVISPYCLKS